MPIYLPIAELSVQVFLIFGMGLAVGFISGLFGIGGGFLMTPLLIFSGVPPAVAVATVSSHMAASSFSGVLSYWRKKAIDIELGMVLLAGGLVGTAAGVGAFALLRQAGQLDLMIAVSYVLLLGFTGSLMVIESARALLSTHVATAATARRPEPPKRFDRLPFRRRFEQSRIEVSMVPVVGIGVFIGFIGALMGVGGGFLLVPLLIYLLRVPTGVVVGTSLFLTLVTMLAATLLHAVTNRSVDVVLALILMVGGVIGAQFGARAGFGMKSEQLRLLLGLLVLGVGLRFLYDLVIKPEELFALEPSFAGARP